MSFKVYAKERKQKSHLDMGSPAPEVISPLFKRKKEALKAARRYSNDYEDVRVVG